VCVVLDTNIWRKQYLLRTPVGWALLHWLHRHGAKIGLPEVVEKELPQVCAREASDHINKIQSHINALNKLLGADISCRLPVEEDLAAAVAQRFDELSNYIERMPITLKDTRGALRRAIEHIPPNSRKHEQFRDSLVWEAVRQLSRHYRVIFVVGDKAFFRNMNPEEGLAPALLDEIASGKFDLEVVHKLSDCVERLKEAAELLDEAEVLGVLGNEIEQIVGERAHERGFNLGSQTGHSLTLLPAGDHGELAVDFEFRYKLGVLEQSRSEIAHEGIATINGECMFYAGKDRASDIKLDTIQYQWTNELGETEKTRDIFAYVRA